MDRRSGPDLQPRPAPVRWTGSRTRRRRSAPPPSTLRRRARSTPRADLAPVAASTVFHLAAPLRAVIPSPLSLAEVLVRADPCERTPSPAARAPCGQLPDPVRRARDHLCRWHRRRKPARHLRDPRPPAEGLTLDARSHRRAARLPRTKVDERALAAAETPPPAWTRASRGRRTAEVRPSVSRLPAAPAQARTEAPLAHRALC